MRPSRWLRASADDVAVGLLAAMFVAFILQIVARYVFNVPIGWTVEVCLTTWLWVRLLGRGLLPPRPRPRHFDMLYRRRPRRLQRVLAHRRGAGDRGRASSPRCPRRFDYVTFYRIKRSTTLRHPPGLRVHHLPRSSPSPSIVRYRVARCCAAGAQAASRRADRSTGCRST